MGKKLDELIEGYKPIPMRRMFYPRGMKLSEDFINAFHREYDRLVDEGLNPKSLVERFGKAMKFHATESRKYHQLDEEKAKLAAIEEANKKKADNKKPDEDGDGVPDWADKKPGKDDHHKDSDKGTKNHKKKHR